jgi:hypothetical protein
MQVGLHTLMLYTFLTPGYGRKRADYITWVVCQARMANPAASVWCVHEHAAIIITEWTVCLRCSMFRLYAAHRPDCWMHTKTIAGMWQCLASLTCMLRCATPRPVCVCVWHQHQPQVQTCMLFREDCWQAFATRMIMCSCSCIGAAVLGAQRLKAFAQPRQAAVGCWLHACIRSVAHMVAHADQTASQALASRTPTC